MSDERGPEDDAITAEPESADQAVDQKNLHSDNDNEFSPGFKPDPDRPKPGDETDADIDTVAKSLAGGDLTALADVASWRADQKLHLYARAKFFNPNFNTKDIQIKMDTLKEFTSGKTGDQIQSFNTFMV